MKKPRFDSYLLSFIIIFLIALFLRVYRIGSKDLWFDEILSLGRALGEYPRFDPQPPLYFLLLRFWAVLLGKSELSLRLLSAIPALLSVIMAYKIGSLLLDRKAGLLGALILSFSPIHIWYSQEVRAFSLFTFLTLSLVYFFCLALKTQRKYYWVAACLTIVISLYVSYWTLLLVAALSPVFILRGYRRFFKIWLLCVFAGLACFLPWLETFFMHFSFIADDFWVTKPAFRRLLVSIENFNLGYTAVPIMYIFSWVSFGTLFASGIIGLIKEKKKDVLLILGAVFILPILLTFLISLKFPVYLDRHLIAFSPFYYLIVSYGLKNLKPYVRLILSSTIIFLSAIALYFYYIGYIYPYLTHHLGAYDKKPFRPAAGFVLDRKEDQDIIAVTNDGLIAPFAYYLRLNPLADGTKLREKVYHLIWREALDNYWVKMYDYWSSSDNSSALCKVIYIYDNSSITIIHKRIWLVSGSWARDYALDENSAVIRDWMMRRYRCKSERWIDGILIGLYEQNK